MSRRRYLLLLACLAFAQGAAPAIAKELSFEMQEIETGLNVGYAVRILDMNDDARPDIVVVDTNRVVWYENPDWNRHTLIEDQTKLDNVCIAPYDIDGDGRVDFALGADWRPADTVSSGSLQWLSRGATGNGEQGDGTQGDSDQEDGRWSVHPIGEEPTIHRINWADFDGDGRAELIVVPLMGRGTTRPLFAERPIRILSYAIPADPVAGPWTPTVINEDLHVAHNFEATDMDGDGKLDLLVVSFEGVSVLRRGDDGTWTRTLIGSGNQETSPNRGASEVKHGRLAAGDYVATIEPWHGFQVVTYTRPEREGELWTRHLLDDQLQWGHAVWAVNLDDDDDEELVIGVRDNQPAGEGLCGVRIYDPTDAAAGEWQRQLVDPGGVAVEDLAAADLDGDGRADIVAVGRATHNVRIYWNRE
jgi:hypothetical protein